MFRTLKIFTIIISLLNNANAGSPKIKGIQKNKRAIVTINSRVTIPAYQNQYLALNRMRG